jgi:hypothetical protein
MQHAWKRYAYKISVNRPERMRLLGRLKRNIRLDLKEIWWEGVDWTHLAQDTD